MVEALEGQASPGKQGVLEQTMKIMVTGFPGLLASDLVPVLQTRHEVLPLSIGDLDITQKESVCEKVKTWRPELIVNCAGFTQVDLAEAQPRQAFQTNALGAHYLALACLRFDVILCQISTDYVFNGQARSPYQPWDSPDPINTYGASKRAGEFYIQSLLSRYFIIRTSSLYGRHGPNFVRTVLEKAAAGDCLTVVEDQLMSPTWAVNLSRGILALIHSGNFGIHHLTDRTEAGLSWYAFAQAVLKATGSAGEIRPISSRTLKRPARRPAYSVLDISYTTLATGYPSLFWQKALQGYLDSF
jgi:dTDP-4-dehydrorhamnose reductase